jgi:hypothetical protein
MIAQVEELDEFILVVAETVPPTIDLHSPSVVGHVPEGRLAMGSQGNDPAGNANGNLLVRGTGRNRVLGRVRSPKAVGERLDPTLAQGLELVTASLFDE